MRPSPVPFLVVVIAALGLAACEPAPTPHYGPSPRAASGTDKPAKPAARPSRDTDDDDDDGSDPPKARSEATGDPATAADPPATARCPSASTPTSAGTIQAKDVKEASGIVASKQNPDVFWVHNDSGDTARVFAIAKSGALLATLTFSADAVTDVEDIAIEDTADGSFLYLADIGDNDALRGEVTIHRIPEPKLAPGLTNLGLSATSETMRVRYEDGPHNAETLLFDPIGRDLLIATKVAAGAAAIHRLGRFVPGSTTTTKAIAAVPIVLATGGDISRDGLTIAIRDYGTTASVWRRTPGEELGDVLQRPACRIPMSPAETKGEALGFLPDGSGYVTLSEGKSSTLHIASFR